MSLIRLHDIHKSYDDTPVLREVFFRLEDGDRVGLIGKNGSGKTTLLKLILKQEEPTSGTIDLNANLKIGYFSQFSTLDGEVPVTQILDDVFFEVHALEEQMLEIEIAFEENPEGDAMDRLLHQQAELLEEMERAGAWTYENQIDTALSRLGFSKAHRTRPINQLSGGWRNRAALAKILLEQPDVLLLDEPTNFLDIEGLAWLEEWLHQFKGAALIVSHDRQFINRIVTRIVEIENYHFHAYQGNYTQYVREKPLRLKTLTRQFEYEEELLIYESQAIVDRQEAAKNPTQALKRKLANVKKRTEPKPVDRIITNIYARMQSPNQMLRVESLSKAYDEQSLFSNVSFELFKGERLAIVGPNGCGKTTLLKTLIGDVEADDGRLVWGKAASYVYYNQIFEELDLKDTVSHAVNITGLAYIAPRKQVHRFLSMMQFNEMDLQQRIGTLSGGQRARVALAKALLSGASVIILDEPTNHLDMTSTQVMERALLHFPGAVIVVSHDRFFIDKIATRLLIFEHNSDRVLDVNGNWTLYQALREREE